MEPQELLNLFDSYWFGQPFLSREPPHPIREDGAPRQPKLLVSRSFSDNLSGFSLDSPTSVLNVPRLRTVLTGEETGDSSGPRENAGGRARGRRRRRRTKGRNKSLPELECEELKGFIDLGFVFSDEDKNSRLGSIIPGLQRLGRKTGDGAAGEGEGEEEEKGSEVPRPYLSEAWDVLDHREAVAEHPGVVVDWGSQAFGDETEMKKHIKSWAHSVASSVKR